MFVRKSVELWASGSTCKYAGSLETGRRRLRVLLADSILSNPPDRFNRGLADREKRHLYFLADEARNYRKNRS
jgi:hypothetical protein